MKGTEKIDIYFDLAREVKMLGYWKVAVIPVVIGALGTVPGGLDRRQEELEIRVRIKTIRTQYC